MGRRSRCLCAALACAAFFAAAGLAPRTAAADDWADLPQSVQTSSSTSTSAAQNDNTTIQRASPTQTGGSEQTQSTIQVAPTQQSADATSRSTQSAANIAGGGSANQENTSSSSAVSRNSNETKQSSAQNQESAAPPPDPAPAPTQSQSSSQSAPTTQHADSSATSNQVAPTNINISVRIDSPGDNGPVNQTNSSTASAVSDNANTSSQDVKQTQSGGRPGGEQSQSAGQSAPTSQVANATSSSNQVAPTNVNITIRNKSPGDDGAVTQTNASGSSANAGNTNASDQSAGQVQENTGAGKPSILGGNGTPHTYIPRGHTSYPPVSTPQPTPAGANQSQTSTQSAPTTQTSNASSTSVQQAPTNEGVSVTVDKDARDPDGSGRHGTLIQVWIPQAEATQTNSSSAAATAANSNRTTQTAEQRQTAPSGGATQVGGGNQTQALQQSAPTTQIANAGSTAKQSGALNVADGGTAIQTNITLAKATVDNANQTIHDAAQIQYGDGDQLQIIDQTAPLIQVAVAQTLAGLADPANLGADGWSVQTNISSSTAFAGKSDQTTQSAQQVQVGTSETQSQVQVVEQGAASAVHTHARQICRRQCLSSGSTVFTLEHQQSVWSSSTGKGSSRSHGPGASKKTRERVPRDGRLPRAPELPGTAAGAGSGGGGGSLWIFAALLIPFALTASWWARHYGPSAFRRLAGVVVRPERPG